LIDWLVFTANLSYIVAWTNVMLT